MKHKSLVIIGYLICLFVGWGFGRNICLRISCSTELKQDLFVELPSGIEKKQYFKVYDKHVILYHWRGKDYCVTNEIDTGTIIGKHLYRFGPEWMERTNWVVSTNQ